MANKELRKQLIDCGYKPEAVDKIIRLYIEPSHKKKLPWKNC